MAGFVAVFVGRYLLRYESGTPSPLSLSKHQVSSGSSRFKLHQPLQVGVAEMITCHGLE